MMNSRQPCKGRPILRLNKWVHSIFIQMGEGCAKEHKAGASSNVHLVKIKHLIVQC